jgi:hypothetical protein
MTLITIVQSCLQGDEAVRHASSDSDYVFHPISPDNTDQCGMSCISTDASSQVTPDTPDDMDLTPYPFATTEEELDEWERLELSCGKDWSLQLASQLFDVARLTDCGDDGDDSSTIMSDEASFCEEVEGICDLTTKEDFWERHADRSMFAVTSN